MGCEKALPHTNTIYESPRWEMNTERLDIDEAGETSHMYKFHRDRLDSWTLSNLTRCSGRIIVVCVTKPYFSNGKGALMTRY